MMRANRLSRWFFAIALWLGITACAAAETDKSGEDPEFWQANAAYRRGDFAEAARRFEAILENAHSPGIHYNLANALAQNGELDRAILHYLRCLALKPTHEKAKTALEQVMLPSQQAEIGTVTGTLVRTQSGWIGVATFGWFAVAAAVGRFWFREKCSFFRPAMGAAIVAVAVSLLVTQWPPKATELGVIVAAENVPLKLVPTKNSPVLLDLAAGTIVVVRQHKHGFTQVETVADFPVKGWTTGEQVTRVFQD